MVTHAPGAAPEIADVFFESPEVRAINLIGGVKTAKMLAKHAGETLKRTTMELGGYNPMIILDDVDMDYAVRIASAPIRSANTLPATFQTSFSTVNSSTTSRSRRSSPA